MKTEFLSKQQRADFYIAREKRIDIQELRWAKEPLYFKQFNDRKENSHGREADLCKV